MRLQIFTKAWSAALLNALGDVLSQVFIEGHSFSKLDWKRLGIFTFLVSHPCSVGLQSWLSHVGQTAALPHYQAVQTFICKIPSVFFVGGNKVSPDLDGSASKGGW